MKSVVCFIDGFNLYHAIDDLRDPNPPFAVPSYLKWVNLRGLATAFLTPSTEQLTQVIYFSARATWLPDKSARHDAYIDALRAYGIQPVLGNFKDHYDRCNRCGHRWMAHDEKESDVSLAAFLVHYAHTDQFEKALIVTADSDQCPAIRIVRETFPKKEVVVLVPPGRFDSAHELRRICTDAKKMKRKHLGNNLLPEKIVGSKGELIAQRPAEYQPPT